VVLATFGSLGDLHPFVALARGLEARGHTPVLATSEVHRQRVEDLGIGFRPVRPSLVELENDREAFRRGMDAREGPAYVIRELFMPHLRAGVDDLIPALDGADLVVAHTIAFPAPIAAALAGTPWASVVLAPMALISKFDPPVSPMAPALRHLRPLGPWFWGPFWRLAKWSIRSWGEPVHRLRAELGLPPVDDPVFGPISPDLLLAAFSEVFGAPQPDWPPSAVQTGFLFFDRRDGRGLDPDLARFLDAGEPPVVFTLGSSAVNVAGPFYGEGLAAARSLGRRAVLLVGKDERNRPAGPLPDTVFVAEYAPYSDLFPRAAAVVHQGGVGTTAQALRAGVPMLVVPWSHDQFDNADRVVRLGAGRMTSRNRLNARALARELSRLLGEPSYAARAAEVGRRVSAEDGVAAACDAIEAFLGRCAGLPARVS
jgi:UDP:flavonoid glycosyltransferase YjiC (YdhE family)